MTPAQRINAALRRLPTWPIYAAALAWPLWLLWQGLTGELGPDPVKAMEQALGRTGLKVLVAGLAVTPLRRLTGINLIRFRRALGLAGFWLIAMHLLVWLVLDVQIPAQIWADIVKRPYITVGMAGFALMVPLAATSWNGAIRRMGPVAWRRLHRLVYPAVLLGAVHYVMVGKVWQPEALGWLAAVVVLLALRLPVPGRARAGARA